ncbi:MAG: hypothetical protein JOY62_19180 [Acidobacteriaceae bacterium]|nr:hypothetical protein [Acidobacteriaceae bacterium]MBV9782089.1 hypothetical protein [Acidobacteriaceae bacterium]
MANARPNIRVNEIGKACILSCPASVANRLPTFRCAPAITFSALIEQSDLQYYITPQQPEQLGAGVWSGGGCVTAWLDGDSLAARAVLTFIFSICE